MDWTQIAFDLEADACPRVESMLGRSDVLAITYLDPGGRPVLEPEAGDPVLWPQVRIVALLEGPAAIGPIWAQLCAHLGREPPGWSVETVEDRPWERVWLDECVPLRFGDWLWVVPAGLEAPVPEAVNVRLDPGLAFGSGTHPSTALCLEWLAEFRPCGRSIVDYGCGSGILAVAALCLGARIAYGVDTDAQALLASRDNAERNGVSSRLRLLAADGAAPPAVDLVMANILARILCSLASELARLTRPGGTLVLAGILQDQVDTVAEAFGGAFRFESPRIRDGWVCLIGRRQGGLGCESPSGVGFDAL
ncbi:50S ribosomal protein L11 methyltransferase [Nitrococcus mobilis]|uniref:Ribosomal protein L11 methyltransferase n=1 Tax=Nitrococcus mobilis Nb-231 TaxID=314278 RepID=A4BSG2_9GAMM|nr:50S ribosomal protein L11 methyltransferase [Nitrococcus mobilis]EAR21422.1 ribosomal protein L11 methyltransferase [Nitrococcus mobilis Nb-231]